MHQELNALLRAPMRRPRRNRNHDAGFTGRGPMIPPAGGRRGGRHDVDDAARREADLALRQGPPSPPEDCLVPGRILVTSRRYCAQHGRSTRLRSEHHHRTPSPTPRRTLTPTYSPMYSPLMTSTPAPRHTIAARRGALPLYINTTPLGAPVVFDEPELAPPPPPPTNSSCPGRATATVAANRRLGLRWNMIPTGHVPAPVGTNASGGSRCPPPPGEGEA
ncbi:hypothetical protein SETIT_5G120100v2 [Setaria italica]|uniref:Uncharacterized protein n=1 Tax=Setaria italica TaxID=4555 RepID=A0A368R3U5_SETIT|nr:hypothetical protein SETIT_5G120100v2 [Setaria italica]